MTAISTVLYVIEQPRCGKLQAVVGDFKPHHERSKCPTQLNIEGQEGTGCQLHQRRLRQFRHGQQERC